MATRRIRDRLLEALGDHPLFSRRQLDLYLKLSGRSVRQGLAELAKHGCIRQYNTRLPGLWTSSLFAPTAQGIEALAQSRRMPNQVYARQKNLSGARLGRLILHRERVFQLGAFFLWFNGAMRGSRGTSQESRSSDNGATSAGTRSRTSQGETRITEGVWYPHAWDVEVIRFLAARRARSGSRSMGLQ